MIKWWVTTLEAVFIFITAPRYWNEQRTKARTSKRVHRESVSRESYPVYDSQYPEINGLSTACEERCVFEKSKPGCRGRAKEEQLRKRRKDGSATYAQATHVKHGYLIRKPDLATCNLYISKSWSILEAPRDQTICVNRLIISRASQGASLSRLHSRVLGRPWHQRPGPVLSLFPNSNRQG